MYVAPKKYVLLKSLLLFRTSDSKSLDSSSFQIDVAKSFIFERNDKIQKFWIRTKRSSTAEKELNQWKLSQIKKFRKN